MINQYNPKGAGIHTVRITFMSGELIGHIAFEIGGESKGGEIISSATEFLSDCGEDDIMNLVENDCNFTIHIDEDQWYTDFDITLKKGDDYAVYEGLDEDELEAMIVSIEIADYDNLILPF